MKITLYHRQKERKINKNKTKISFGITNYTDNTRDLTQGKE